MQLTCVLVIVCVVSSFVEGRRYYNRRLRGKSNPLRDAIIKHAHAHRDLHQKHGHIDSLEKIKRKHVDPLIHKRGHVDPLIHKSGLVDPLIHKHGHVDPLIHKRGHIDPLIHKHGHGHGHDDVPIIKSPVVVKNIKKGIIKPDIIKPIEKHISHKPIGPIVAACPPLDVCAALMIPPQCREPTFIRINGRMCPGCDRDRCAGIGGIGQIIEQKVNPIDQFLDKLTGRKAVIPEKVIGKAPKQIGDIPQSKGVSFGKPPLMEPGTGGPFVPAPLIPDIRGRGIQDVPPVVIGAPPAVVGTQPVVIGGSPTVIGGPTQGILVDSERRRFGPGRQIRVVPSGGAVVPPNAGVQVIPSNGIGQFPQIPGSIGQIPGSIGQIPGSIGQIGQISGSIGQIPGSIGQIPGSIGQIDPFAQGGQIELALPPQLQNQPGQVIPQIPDGIGIGNPNDGVRFLGGNAGGLRQVPVNPFAAAGTEPFSGRFEDGFSPNNLGLFEDVSSLSQNAGALPPGGENSWATG